MSTDDILAKKQAWKEKRIDRRVKDGSIEDRKNLSDCIRKGRQIRQDKPVSWWKQLLRTALRWDIQ